MMNILEMTPKQLREIAGLKEQIEQLQHEVASILGEFHEVAKASAKTAKKNGHARNGKLHWTQTPEGRRTQRRNRLKYLRNLKAAE
jgi:hypothetical protein